MGLASGTSQAPLPSSWRACRAVLGHVGLRLTAAETFGFGAGLGWGYRSTPSPLLVGYGGWDPPKDLALTVGVWFERSSHCTSVSQALEAMRLHLKREQIPIVVALSSVAAATAPDSDLPYAERRTFVCAHQLDEKCVGITTELDSPMQTVGIDDFRERLLGHEAQWCVVFGNGTFIPLSMRLRTALFRTWHRLRTGWRNTVAGVEALPVALSRAVLNGSPESLARTRMASNALGGGFGRRLFAEFLMQHRESLHSSTHEVARYYETLGQRWCDFERQLMSHGISQAEGADLVAREREGVRMLGDLCTSSFGGLSS